MTSGFLELFKVKKPIIAVIHLKGETKEEVMTRAKKEISIYADNGIDGGCVKNYV